MTAFRLASVTLNLGYDCSSLSSTAHALESSAEFKRAAEVDFDRHFDVWLQDRSFTTPYAGRNKPNTTLTPDAFGDLEPQQVLDLLREVFQAHARASTVNVISATSSTCVWDPRTGEWVNIGGYPIELDGQPYTADAATTDFEAAYRANRPTVPATFDADLAELRALRASAFVSWTV